MDLSQVIVVMTIIVTNMGAVLYLHFRGDDKLAAAIKDSTEKMEKSSKETRELIEAIRKDMQLFHGRLCTIEERARK